MEPVPYLQPTKRKRNPIGKTLNLHTVGRHFVENITEIEETPTETPVGQSPTGREERPSTDLRFRSSVRGWNKEAHRSRAKSLLVMKDTQMTAALQINKDIIPIPRRWSDKSESLEPEDPGWWYTVPKAMTFQECQICERRRGDDLDEGTKSCLNRTCRGCRETFQEPAKQKRGRKETGKAGTPSEKRKTISQRVSQREQRPRLHDVRNKSMNEEGKPDD